MLNLEMIKEAEVLYVEKGYTSLKVIEQLGISNTTFYKWCKQYNWNEKRQQFLSREESLPGRVDRLIQWTIEELVNKFDSRKVLALQRLVSTKKDLTNIRNMEIKKDAEQNTELNKQKTTLTEEELREIEKKLFDLD